MRLIFAGTPEFAATALQALIDAGHEIPLVLTQPDRPAGRGMQLRPSAVKVVAQQHHLRVAQPASLKKPEDQLPIQEAGADLMVVAAYGLILPQAVLDMPRLGCWNIHASLLPRWRGAAPIQRAILAGDQETGITIMQMDAGLDTGAMLLRKPLAISNADTTQTLHDRLAALGASSILEAIELWSKNGLPAEPQDNALATYAAKICKEEARIDWSRPAQEIARAVRAYNPFPGAFTSRDGETLKIWSSQPVSGAGTPGMVLAAAKQGIVVACGEGALSIQELQRAGGKRLPVTQFLGGLNLAAGEQWS